MPEWRWDQGRILYFQYDVLKAIARVLVKYDARNINNNDLAYQFKKALIEDTGMPFLPDGYKVNRNYSRVFQCAMLATTKDKGFLTVTDICRQLASDNSIFDSADDYLFEIVNRFRYPYPAFQEYNASEERVYPFCAILKYLIAQKLSGKDASMTLQDISSFIIGNKCTGLEDIDFYKNLKATSHIISGDSLRQLREMTVFIGQLSFLKIFNKRIYLDVISEDDALTILNQLISPILQAPLQNKVEEFLQITHLKEEIFLSPKKRTNNIILPSADSSDIEFAEGKRKRVHHLRIERSPLLRRIYIQLHPNPVCDACKLNVREKYPWVGYMLDLHHLLPLSSVIRTTIESGTTLTDIVGLCPSCHRAIHSYYSKWFKANNREDFKSRKEAMEIYLDAIREIV